MPRFLAIRSAPSNWLGMSIAQSSGRGSPSPGGTLPPSGIRDIASTPQATPTSMLPAATMSCDEVGRLLAGAALGVDDGAAGVLGESLVEPGAAHHVVGLLAGLGDAAADDLLDQLRVDARAPEHLLLHEAEQLRRVQPGEPALALAERCADGIDDHGVAHGAIIAETRTRSCCAA